MLAVVAIFFTASFAQASFEDGMRAYTNNEPEKALDAWLPLAKHGEARAQYWLSRLYHHNRNVSESKRWLIRAAGQHFEFALVDLGILRNEEGDTRQAVELLKKAAALSNEGALMYLCYVLHGNKTERAKLVDFYRVAAIHGNRIAQKNLGLLYMHGACGLQENKAEAAILFAQASKQGLAEAQFHLFRAYEQGIGVPKDSRKAANLLRRAANQGHAGAQAYLGEAFLKGQDAMGISRDFKKSYFWLWLAINSWFAGQMSPFYSLLYYYYASEIFSEVSNKMSQRQIADTERLIRDWEPILE